MLAVFLGSVTMSALLVWISIRLAQANGALDRPDGLRKLQSEPIPRWGGLAVGLAFSIAVIVAALVLQLQDELEAIGLVAVASAMAILGLVDDRKSLGPWVRLSLQVLAASAAWQLGTRVGITGSPMLDFLLFILWVVVIINGINLLDNSDGLAASTSFLASVGFGIIAVLSGQELVSLLAVALAGVSLGFLVHNWAPARVYLGDSGAYFLGFSMAVLAVRVRPDALTSGWAALIPVLILILPIVDTTYVVVRRVASGIHPFTAGRDHLSHSLQRRGLSTAHSVLALQLLTIAGILAAILMTVALD